MSIYTYLAIAMFLPIILAVSSIPFRVKQLSKVNINEPRFQAEQLTGAGGRLVAAQKNAWEALILFTVTLFIAYANQVEPAEISLACLVFILARISHAVFYVAGIGHGRFTAFIVALGAITSILWTSLA